MRAFAALLIIFYHGVLLFSYDLRFGTPFSLENWSRASNPFEALIFEGHTAVAFFMVLSGFIFTWGAYNRDIVARKFILNRLLRTYPLFVLLTIVGAYIYRDRFDFLGVLQILFGFANAPGAMNLDAFSSMFWAISIEWQFYIIFPLLFLIMNRTGPRAILGLILVFWTLRLFAFLMEAEPRDLTYFTIVGRMDQFLIGMLTAVLYHRYFKENLAWDSLCIASVVALLLALFAFNQAGGWPANVSWKFVWPSIEGVLWAAFILGYSSFSRHIPRLVSTWLCGIGIISYSLYLIHNIVLMIALRNGWMIDLPGEPYLSALLTTLLLLPIIMLISCVTYFSVEKPFLEMRGQYLKEVADPVTPSNAQ